MFGVNAHFDNKYYTIHKLFGFTIKSDKSLRQIESNTETIRNILKQIENPYILKKSWSPKIKINKIKDERALFYATLIAKTFTFFCKKSFVFFRLFSFLRVPLFDTMEEAILFYRELFPGMQKDLCLPRALFAMCSSRVVDMESALVIGIFLPSRSMHAWVFEKGKQPDPFDDIWICYQPVAVMVNK